MWLLRERREKVRGPVIEMNPDRQALMTSGLSVVFGPVPPTAGQAKMGSEGMQQSLQEPLIWDSSS